MTTPTATTTYGAATEQAITTVTDTCQRYGSSSIVALAGVPGTGKSFIGQIAAQRLAGDPLRVREMQFHPATTYEEFVEGLRIDALGAITVSPGLFLEWNDYALENPGLTWVLLVDELTRANVSAVLGELMTFVEDRSRPFTTTYSRRPVKVAENLVILTTYNPTDRSALEIDNALLRRLRVLHFPPDVGQLREMLSGRKVPANAVDALVKLFDETSRKHPKDYEHLMPFGHGIFAEVEDEVPDLHALWQQRLRHFLHRPLVQAHPFADTIENLYPWTSPTYVAP